MTIVSQVLLDLNNQEIDYSINKLLAASFWAMCLSSPTLESELMEGKEIKYSNNS